MFSSPDGGSRATVDQLRRLTEVSRALTYTTSLDEVMRLTVRRGVELLEADCGVLMLSDSSGLLQVRASHGIAPERVTRFCAPLDDELIARLKGLLGVSDQCFIGVPLVVAGEVTGLVAVALRHESSDSDEWILSALADQAAVALENARLSGEVRIEMEDRLQKSKDATDAKERALATLAHDFRTPLGAIEGYCTLMEDEICGPITDRQRDALGRVRMSGRHLLSLLDNVMDMARLDAGVMHVARDPIPLQDVVREAVHMLIPAADAKLQTLVVGRMDPITVIGDHAQLRQVLVNIIGNAVKFTPQDGSVSITTSEVEIEGKMFGEIRVTDTGPGISADDLKSVFEPYYRGASVTTTPGVGLGLAISHRLLQHMDGSLAVESSPGDGASFIVRLPLG